MSKQLSRKQQRQTTQAKATRMKWIRYGGIALFILIAGISLALWRNAGTIPDEGSTTLVKPNLDGSPDAPVQVVEYADLTCSACRQWHNLGIKEQLQAEAGNSLCSKSGS